MDLPKTAAREKYLTVIKDIETALKQTSTAQDTDTEQLAALQIQLDTVARIYQDDESIGTARYKLYELQALISHYSYDDDKALDFINHAIDVRGSNYEKAVSLKQAISSSQRLPSSHEPVRKNSPVVRAAENKKKYVGLNGWLAVFIVGQIIALLITIVNFLMNVSVSQGDVQALNDYQSGLGDTFQALSGFENIMIIIGAGLIVTTIVLLIMKKTIAKAWAIVMLLFIALYGVIDYAVASSLLSSAGLVDTDVLQSYAGDVGRSILAALIWVPYFIFSKRVKQTLTRS